MDEHNKKVEQNIEKNGCHITHINSDNNRPAFTYSTGIERQLGSPEILVTGMDKDSAHFIINEYNYRIKDSEKFEAGKFYDDFLEDVKITFKEIDKKYYSQYLSSAQSLYKGDDFNALHFIWPDINGAWPWEKKATKDYRLLMPPLYTRK